MIDLTKEKPLKVKEAAELFGVTPRTIDNWFADGLERVRRGNRIYTTREALNRFFLPDATPPDDTMKDCQERLRRLGFKTRIKK